MQIVKPSIKNGICVASMAQFSELQHKHYGTLKLKSKSPYLGEYSDECFFIEPTGLTDEQMEIWVDSCLNAEGSYEVMIGHGANHIDARAVLPDSAIVTFWVPDVRIDAVALDLGIANEKS